MQLSNQLTPLEHIRCCNTLNSPHDGLLNLKHASNLFSSCNVNMESSLLLHFGQQGLKHLD